VMSTKILHQPGGTKGGAKPRPSLSPVHCCGSSPKIAQGPLMLGPRLGSCSMPGLDHQWHADSAGFLLPGLGAEHLRTGAASVEDAIESRE
jgi:hypothetical protein